MLTQCSSISPKAELAKNLTPSLFFSFSNDYFDEFFLKKLPTKSIKDNNFEDVIQNEVKFSV